MKIKVLKLFTNQLERQKKFYSQIIGFEIFKESESQFSLKTGWSELTFVQTIEPHYYHYCFLIPSNKLYEALDWMNNRTQILDVENGNRIANFSSWNADSFYFYDGGGNIAEFIVRYDLKNETNKDFDLSDILCIHEIGIGTSNVEAINNQLEKELGTQFWKGDLIRFGTNGSLEGIFLLANYELKATWYPTEIQIKPTPFQVIIENNGNHYLVDYENENINSALI